MIHIAVGTKAQVVKMAPVMWRLMEERVEFNLIDLGQHSSLTSKLRAEFGLAEPAVCLYKGKMVSSPAQALGWLCGLGYKSISSRWIKEKVFAGKYGICLIHGDTLSTLVGLYLAKRAGIKVAHIEAGLRSFRWLEPFPEEIIRVVGMRCSDLLFAPSAAAFNNLKKMGLSEKAVLLTGNTAIETVHASLKEGSRLSLKPDKFCLITFHRAETIFSRKRLLSIIGMMSELAGAMPVVFVQHKSTLCQLARFNLLGRIYAIKNIFHYNILSHSHFIQLLKKCELVVTDGGSIQEEAYYLGKPCLLLRSCTERDEGLGSNAELCAFDRDKMRFFFSRYKTFEREIKPLPDVTPSSVIVDRLKQYF
ncbi:MAG: UDP-N-acetylglucosamine 2-epimerase [Candidatus Omnitrophica bacterium]|nr:UDP-N-acetylglucosamine 2-epimerase [Candidatus Omnitrophota bacterium]